MVDNDAAKPQADGDTKNDIPLFVRMLLSGPYTIGIALIGGALLYEAIRHGRLWRVYVGICFLVPFGLFLSCFVVQIAACVVWRVLNLPSNQPIRDCTREEGEP